jgi:DUF2975 family protein
VPPPAPSYAATVAHRLTALLLVLSIVFGVFMTVDALRGGARDVVVDASAPLDDKRLPKGVWPTSEQRTGFQVQRPSARQRRLAYAADMLPLLLWIAVLWQLRGIARSVRDGDPFGHRNVARLRIIGVLLIVGGLAVDYGGKALQDAIADPYLRPASAPVSTPGLRPAHHDLPDTALMGGLIAFVLAQVFAHGVQLREDVEATI